MRSIECKLVSAPSSVTLCTVDQDGALKLLAVRVLDNPFTLKTTSAQSYQRHRSALSPSLNQRQTLTHEGYLLKNVLVQPEYVHCHPQCFAS